MANFIRRQVSLKKKRYQKDGYDLDLAYITPNLIAMGFPATGFEKIYRNPMSQVKNFLEDRHKDHYKVYNLCIEDDRNYNWDTFKNRVARYPFYDHQAPPLQMMSTFCDDVETWLAQDPTNLAAVHCKAGKGRAGMMTCCYLIHSGTCPNADEAMDFFARERTYDLKGVTIPSQRRYVHYYEEIHKYKLPVPPTINLSEIKVFSSRYVKEGKTEMYCEILLKGEEKVFTSAIAQGYGGLKDTIIDCQEKNIMGDIKVIIYDKLFHKDKPLCHVWFNTAFIDGNQLLLKKPEIDKIDHDKKNKKFRSDFEILFLFKGSEVSAMHQVITEIKKAKRAEKERKRNRKGTEAFEREKEEKKRKEKEREERKRKETSSR